MIDTWIESSFDLHRCKSIHDGVAGSFTMTLARPSALRCADCDGDGGKAPIAPASCAEAAPASSTANLSANHHFSAMH
jgi:hypothetical protein